MTERSSRNQDTTVNMWSLHVNEFTTSVSLRRRKRTRIQWNERCYKSASTHVRRAQRLSRRTELLILVLEPVRQSTERLMAARLHDTQRRHNASRRFKENL